MPKTIRNDFSKDGLLYQKSICTRVEWYLMKQPDKVMYYNTHIHHFIC